LQYEDKNIFNYLQVGGGFGFFRRYHRTGFLIRHEIMRNYFVQGNSTAADADSLRDNTISKVALSVSFDTRNNFADPTRGLFLMGNTDFYNEIRGKNANFVKFRFYFGHYFEFLRYFTIANNLRVDRIQTLGDNVSIPSNELFQLGGDDTIRGFTEDSLGPVNAGGNPIGGRVRWIYNGELRIKLFKNFKLAGFYDTGALVNEFNDINLGTVRQSIGFGLRYITPVGPLRFDYGIILDPKKNDHFGRFHLTFGYVF
jgi:outer membrane protein insertion porin family